MKARWLSLGGLVGIVALLVSVAVASAKLPPGSTFEVCGESGCERLGAEEALDLQIRLIEPAIEHGSASPPTGERPWFRVNLLLGDPLPGMTLGTLERRFPVVYSDGYVGVPSGEEGGYRWIELSGRNLAAYERAVGDAEPFPAADLGGLTQRGVAAAAAEDGPEAGSDPAGLPTWLLIALAAGAGLIGLGALHRLGHRPARHEPA